MTTKISKIPKTISFKSSKLLARESILMLPIMMLFKFRDLMFLKIDKQLKSQSSLVLLASLKIVVALTSIWGATTGSLISISIFGCQSK